MSIVKESFSKGNVVACNGGSDLHSFLEEWDVAYVKKLDNIELFDSNINSKFSDSQKEKFARLFYHVRGNFYKFLWFLGNHATKYEFKEQVLHNIKEEFGGGGDSHEKLYFEFCKSLGFNIEDEFVYEVNNQSFIKDFNLKHIEWLSRGSEASRWATFSAYERLDNIDYGNLLVLAKNLGSSEKGLEFFAIHNKADHFDRTYDILSGFWAENKHEIKKSFGFISENQVLMWNKLSEFLMPLA